MISHLYTIAYAGTTVQQPKPPSHPKEPPPSQTDSMNVDDEDEAFENELLQELLQNQRSQNSGEVCIFTSASQPFVS